MGRVSEKEPLFEWISDVPAMTNVEQPCQWEGELTLLQEKASLAIAETIRKNEQLLIEAVCGAGKTEMLYAGIDFAIREGKRVCIATPRSDVVRELAPRLRRDFPRIKAAALYGGSTEKDQQAHLVIATTHQLLRYKNSFDVVIIDEVDAFPFHHDKMLPKAVGRAVKDNHAKIYLTATPRLDMKLASLTRKIPTVSIPQRFHGHPLPVPQFKQIFRLNKHLDEQSLHPKIKEWMKARGDRRYLLFASTVAMAKKLSDELGDVPYVHSESPNRKGLIQKFRNKEMQALITTTILERGVTFPSIDVAVIQADHKVFDEAALVQIAGRAGRSANDPTGDVTFFFEAKTHAIVQARKYTLNKNREAGLM
ncbi:helicase-related protein [Halalkalibacillus sediminis]|nr:helicase-related protein [Halalkalibacillus sediminis]